MAGRAPRVRRVRRPGRPLRFAIVAARFNERITQRLVQGALQAFRGARLSGDAVEVHWVPGAFELPQAAGHLAATGRYAGIVCVGVVIRGQTPHFEHVAREAAAGIREVALTTGVPATYGVVTALSEEQAWARAGGEVGTGVRRPQRRRSRWPSGSTSCGVAQESPAPQSPRERSPALLLRATHVCRDPAALDKWAGGEGPGKSRCNSSTSSTCGARTIPPRTRRSSGRATRSLARRRRSPRRSS